MYHIYLSERKKIERERSPMTYEQKKMKKRYFRPKYFKDLECELPSEFSGKYNSPEQKKLQMQTDGILYADSFNLDCTIAIFMYTHLMHYKDKAKKMIVLDDVSWKIDWCGEKITLLEAINILAQFFKMYAETDNFDFFSNIEDTRKYFILLADIFPGLWW